MNNRFKEARKQAGMTQRDLGEKIGVNHSLVAMIESGKRNPSPRTIRDIAQACHVSEDWLRTGEGPMRPESPAYDPDSTVHYLESEYNLTPSMTELIRLFIELPPEGKEYVEAFARQAASNIMRIASEAESNSETASDQEGPQGESLEPVSRSEALEGLSQYERELIRQAREEQEKRTSSGTISGESDTA